jgi:hypothetical protein
MLFFDISAKVLTHYYEIIFIFPRQILGEAVMIKVL